MCTLSVCFTSLFVLSVPGPQPVNRHHTPNISTAMSDQAASPNARFPSPSRSRRLSRHFSRHFVRQYVPRIVGVRLLQRQGQPHPWRLKKNCQKYPGVGLSGLYRVLWVKRHRIPERGRYRVANLGPACWVVAHRAADLRRISPRHRRSSSARRSRTVRRSRRLCSSGAVASDDPLIAYARDAEFGG